MHDFLASFLSFLMIFLFVELRCTEDYRGFRFSSPCSNVDYYALSAIRAELYIYTCMILVGPNRQKKHFVKCDILFNAATIDQDKVGVVHFCINLVVFIQKKDTP